MNPNQDFIGSSIEFIMKHFLDIILVSLGLIVGLIIITLNDIELFPIIEKTKITEKVFIYESFDNLEETNREKPESILKPSHESICDNTLGESHKTEILCSKMSKSKCSYLPCCVLASFDGKEECVSGNASGPTYHNDDKGNIRNVDYYYYQNKKFKKR